MVETKRQKGRADGRKATELRPVRMTAGFMPSAEGSVLIETGETRGFMKAVIDADTQQILGAAVLGAEGGEIITIIQVAMLGRLTDTAMANAIFTHPLLAEGLNTLFAMLGA